MMGLLLMGDLIIRIKIGGNKGVHKITLDDNIK